MTKDELFATPLTTEKLYKYFEERGCPEKYKENVFIKLSDGKDKMKQKILDAARGTISVNILDDTKGPEIEIIDRCILEKYKTFKPGHYFALFATEKPLYLLQCLPNTLSAAEPYEPVVLDEIVDKFTKTIQEYMRYQRKRIYNNQASKKERGHQILMSIMKQAEITDTEEEFERLTDEIDELADMRFITRAAAQEAQEEIDDKIYELSISRDK